jgi:uncharacterized SAM-binding protein YcdF (DUF218 family)
LLSPIVTSSCEDLDRTFDIAVVMGGGATQDGLTDTSMRRIVEAVRLYQAGNVRAIHATGYGPNGAVHESEASAMRSVALAAGVPAEHISIEDRSRSTLENARFSVPLLPADATLLIVTDRFHTLRSAASFAWAGRLAPFCAVPNAEDSGEETRRRMKYEVLAWGLNIARAGGFSLASLLGQSGRLPDWFLH